MYYKFFNCLFLATALFLFSTCEEVIVLDLDSVEEQLVIEANLNATDNSCLVSLTKSDDFYSDNDFEKVLGASISLASSSGDTYSLNDIGNGQYSIANIMTSPGDSLTIDISISDMQLYSASVIVPKLVILDTLLIEENEGGFSGLGGGNSEGGYDLIVEWKDIQGEENLYRVKVFRNGTFQSDVYILSDDRLNEGATLTRPVIGESYALGDELKVQLLSVNRGYFDYFSDIANGEGRGLSSPVPFNPKSNFNNNAIGYFGVWQVSEKTVTVE